ncbi:Bax inhibitor-1/YccA family protein [Homoserinibacter sp. GY 40078]|uniref:Bax inhibitor-1/YccA family protein n=1 Tax=Homoserinibacter sp. GY 40078 TaxID=2603275 RepID=UPI0011CC4B65|nr:Bax inhibitor-1/YccA family protein [Homoserinibacter sp. GY 40078]TXK17014.1 Bax inhibitor-1/YccA family protein [Homoserinibacter sp. GY 40078]
MALNNPAFSNSPAFNGKGVAPVPTPTAEELQQQFNLPSAPQRSAEPMTIDGTLRVSLGTFAVLVVAAAIGWVTMPAVPFLWIGAAIVGFVLALVNIFKKEPSPALILAYAAAQGVFLGGISSFYEAQWPGIVSQAVLATLAVVGVTLALFASGKIRASKRATKVFLVAMVGYLAFSVINVFVMIFGGANANPWGLRGDIVFFDVIPLGLVLGVFAVLLGAYSLVLDFDFIQKGVRQGIPKKYAWTGAFGIMVTVIWLYLEILRMLAISRD